MLAVEVRFLTDRYVATHFNDRSQPEWPPHPARLFSAMVAAWADDEDPPDAAREALAWFATLGPPDITCSDAARRTDVTHYVPVNDAAIVRDLSGTYEALRRAGAAYDDALDVAAGDLDDRAVQRARKTLDAAERKGGTDSAKAAQAGGAMGGLKVLPSERGRQGRSYPCVVPETPTVCFAWPDARPTEDQWQLIDDVLAKIARLGHSSSMVACRLLDESPAPDLVPRADGGDVLRVTGDGLLDSLERAYARHGGREPRALPSRTARYGRRGTAIDPPRSSMAGDWFVLTPTETSRLPGHRTLRVARAVREALISHADQPVAEILSGHVPGLPGETTAPTTDPHLAVLPLPFVGRYGDGTILGIALQLPSAVSADARRAALRAIASWRADGFTLRLGALGVVDLEMADAAEPLKTVRRERWDCPSHRWVTVTPMALDRHPGDLWSATSTRRDRATAEAEQSVRMACERLGLPEPADVEFGRDGWLGGVDHIRRFEPFQPRNGPRRFLAHVALTFPAPVAGPLVLGAGRFFGYGLFLPQEPRRGSHA